MASYYEDPEQVQNFLNVWMKRQNRRSPVRRTIWRSFLGLLLVVLAVIFRQYLFLTLGSLFFLCAFLMTPDRLLIAYRRRASHAERERFDVTFTPEHLRVRVNQTDMVLSQKNFSEIHPYSTGIFFGHQSGIKLYIPLECLNAEEQRIIATCYPERGQS